MDMTALALGVGGVASGLAVLAQVGDGASSGVAPVATGSAAAIAVSAIVWVLKKAFAGDIVAKPVAQYQGELGVLLAAMAEREDRLCKIIEGQDAIISRQEKLLDETNRLLWRVGERLGGPPDRRRKAP